MGKSGGWKTGQGLVEMEEGREEEPSEGKEEEGVKCSQGSREKERGSCSKTVSRKWKARKRTDKPERPAPEIRGLGAETDRKK